VATTYFVCGSPRAGTSLLAGLLKSTGVAGRPEEYFWRDDMPSWSARWNVSTFGQYVAAALREGTTPNGVFGAKLMWGYMDDFLGRLRDLAGASETSDRALVERFFGGSAFIWIWRGDVVAQAVSWAKAIQTGVWYDQLGDRPVGPAEFDFHQIESLAHQAAAHNRAWRRWFAANKVEPLGVQYEELVSDKVGVARRVLTFLGVEVGRRLSDRATDAQAERPAQRRVAHALSRTRVGTRGQEVTQKPPSGCRSTTDEKWAERNFAQATSSRLRL
jgi:trehalose 2-sulfotransferase